MNGWCTGLVNNTISFAQVAAGGFFNSDEFENKNVSDMTFVTMLYRAFFNREPEDGAAEYWVGEIEQGLTRNYIIKQFTESQEFGNVCSWYGMEKGTYELTDYRDQNAGVTKFIVRLYRMALQREYDVDGLNVWCKGLLENIMTPGEIAIDGFLNSAEFKNRNLNDADYIKTLYRAFLGREASDEEVSGWVDVMLVYSRDEVAQGFADSPEFKNLLAKYGLE